MYARLYIPNTNGDWSIEDLVSDIVAVMCGETDFANLTLATGDGQAFINSTVPGGWTLEAVYDYGEAVNGYKFWVLSSPNADNPSRKKYVQFYVSQTYSNRLMMACGDALSPAGICYSTPNATQVSLQSTVNSRGTYTYNSQAYYVDVSASSNHFCISQMYQGSSTLCGFERTRLLAADTADGDICPFEMFSASSPVANQQPIPRSETDDPNQSDFNNYHNAYIGTVTWSAWASDGNNKAVWTQADGSEKLVMVQPFFGASGNISGKMLDSIPVFVIPYMSAPSTVPGASVYIDNVEYVVWSMGNYGASTTTALYVRVE